jgi:fibronectin-binding autotransporter adhesin
MGLGSFQFTVTANDGASGSNTVNVLMTPITIPQNLTWVGDGTANVWTNGGPANWNNGTNLVAFASGDNVTFDDTGANTPAITLGGAVTAGTVYVIADNQNYTFAGSGYLAGGTALFKTGAGQLTLDTTNTFAGGTLINEGVVQIGDGISYNGALAGNVTNNDTLIFATAGAATNSAAITGPGAVTETGPGALLLSGAQTYTGPTAITAGTLGFSSSLPPSDITNNGTLILAPTTAQNYTNLISGPGNVSVSAGSLLFLSGSNLFTGNLTNNSGFLVLSNSSAAGAGTVVYNGGFVVASANATITNNFYIPGSSASDLCMMATNSGTATWAGNVSIGGSGQWRPGSDGGTLVFLGSAVMGSHIFLIPRGAVQFGSNAVVSSTAGGFLGRDSSGNKRSLNLTVRDNASVAMAGCSIGGGKTGGSVTITVQNNGVLSLGTNVDLHDIANSAAISTLRLNGGTFLVGGFTKTLASYTNIIDFNGGVLQASTNNASFLPSFSPSTNAVQAGGAIINDGGYAITIVGPLMHDPSLGTTADGGLTKLGAGTLTLGSFVAGVQQTYTGPTAILGGALILTSGITNSAAVYVAPGALLNLVTPFTLASGHKLWGGGALSGGVTIGSGGLLAPGSNAIGALTFSNSLTLAALSTNVFKLSQSPLANDFVTVHGALTNGGTLILTNSGGAQLAAGDTFQLFNAGGYSGTFANVILPSLPAGLAWNTSSLNTAGSVSITLNTAPFIGAISVSASGLGLSGTGGVGNAFYVLLGATNLATPAANWTRLLTNQFDNSGNFNFTNSANPANPQTYYRLQLQ